MGKIRLLGVNRGCLGDTYHLLFFLVLIEYAKDAIEIDTNEAMMPNPGVSSAVSLQPSSTESMPPHSPSLYQQEDHILYQSPLG